MFQATNEMYAIWEYVMKALFGSTHSRPTSDAIFSLHISENHSWLLNEIMDSSDQARGQNFA